MRKSRFHRLILRELRNADRILDVGCGDGNLVNFLAKSTKKEVIGLDISNSGFDKALTKASKHGIPNLVRCVKGDAHRIAKYFNKEKFDAVTMTYTLHHLKQPASALRELRKILRPNGQILIVDWVLYEEEEKKGCRKFSVGDVLEMMMETGYSQVRVEDLEPELVLVMAGTNNEKKKDY